ncbi:MAG: FMN-binding protein [Actinobacteria bacterium]|nr:FMN-binding protein [Actinomycetota bacterium]
MRRAPFVIGGTVLGLAGVLAFHTTPTSPTSTPGKSLPASSSGSGSQPSGAQRTATGPTVNYSWGTISVRVTVSGSKIVKIGIASLNDGNNPRSQFIDQQSIPTLEQEALQAQSANIQGVSGASFTSAGFEQSLQAALRSLGIA